MGNGKKSGIAALMRSRNLFTYDDVVELFKQYRFTATDAYEIVENHIAEKLFENFSAETYTLAALYLDLEKKPKFKSGYSIQRELMKTYPRLVNPKLMNFDHVKLGKIHSFNFDAKSKKYKIFNDKPLRDSIANRVSRARKTKQFMKFYKLYWPHEPKKLLKKRFGPIK